MREMCCLAHVELAQHQGQTINPPNCNLIVKTGMYLFTNLPTRVSIG